MTIDAYRSAFGTLLDYDEASGKFRWLVRQGSAAAGQLAGTDNGSGYLTIMLHKRKFYAHQLAWLWKHGRLPSQIDHINGDRSDNRIANLREVTGSQNLANVGTGRLNTSGYRGVSWYAKRRKYQATIRLGGKPRFLGYYDDPKEAAKAYFRAAVAKNGEFVRLPSDEGWLLSGDAACNSIRCWQLAILELRKKGLRDGRFKPETDEERRWLRLEKDDSEGQILD